MKRNNRRNFSESAAITPKNLTASPETAPNASRETAPTASTISATSTTPAAPTTPAASTIPAASTVPTASTVPAAQTEFSGVKTTSRAAGIILHALKRNFLLTILVAISVAGAVISGLLPPLILEEIIDRLTEGQGTSLFLALSYFGLLLLTGLMTSAREGLLTILGQKITRALRTALCEKLSRLPAGTIAAQDPGATASRFVGDVDTVQDLFTNGIISMFADACQVVSIFVILFFKNRGLALLLLLVLPLVFAFTRIIQKRMLRAEIDNRVAIAKVTNLVPETIKSIRTIHTLGREGYMRSHYDDAIQESYDAISRTNFYDAVYSPIILITNAIVVAVVYLLTSNGNVEIAAFFGMSVGTSVAVVNYIAQVFGPLESIGMEIQTIQSAIAGVHRINEFLSQEDRWETEENWEIPRQDSKESLEAPILVELKNVSFSYDGKVTVIHNLDFKIRKGERVTFTGRTGAGKSTVFKLLLGLYRPQKGEILVCGENASLIPDSRKRALFGYVEQTFRRVPGTVRDQITLFDESITDEEVCRAAATAHLDSAIEALEKGYDTPCSEGLFSQGQWQLLSIARAIAAEPPILLLDEITANLDADTEKLVLSALQNASVGRTVLSISHRLYENMGGREIVIGK